MYCDTAIPKKPEATGTIKEAEKEENRIKERKDKGERTPKKRKRRKKIRQQFTTFRLLYNNINHLKSKIEALENAVEETKPTMIVLVETKLPEKEEFKLDGYYTMPINRNENGGGVMLLVKEELENISVIVEQSREVAETMWVVISNGRNNIRMGIVYAPQENKTSVEQLKIMYKKLEDQIKEARTKKQNVLLVGDFNCKVGKKIEGNTEEISKSGKRLLKFADKMGLKIMNSSKACEGTWTRVEGCKKSVLDYIMINEEDEELVKCMWIDEEHNITPYHRQEGRTIYSDHNAMVMDVNWNMRYVSGCQTRMVIL
jgi:exonuclease III